MSPTVVKAAYCPNLLSMNVKEKTSSLRGGKQVKHARVHLLLHFHYLKLLMSLIKQLKNLSIIIDYEYSLSMINHNQIKVYLCFKIKFQYWKQFRSISTFDKINELYFVFECDNNVHLVHLK